MNLEQLTILILTLSETPLTRIRLAKSIYFVHKELVRRNLMKLDAITYTRLPLGPSPSNLEQFLIHNPNITIQDTLSNLLYENKAYNTNESMTEDIQASPEIVNTIKKILHLIESYSTPQLVRSSQDPSWRKHANGDRYQLTPIDLKNTFPTAQFRLKIHIKTSTPNEVGALQATLLRGMLADIVKESTDLEYPNQVQTKPSIDNKVHKLTIKLPSWPKKKDK